MIGNKKCGNCIFRGERKRTGQYIKMPNQEIQFLYFCENTEAISRTCINSATGCEKWKGFRNDNTGIV